MYKLKLTCLFYECTTRLNSSLIHSRAMDNSTTSGSVGELKEESNLIIYIIGLILLIIWKVTVMCQVRLHLKHKRLEELVRQQQLYPV